MNIDVRAYGLEGGLPNWCVSVDIYGGLIDECLGEVIVEIDYYNRPKETMIRFKKKELFFDLTTSQMLFRGVSANLLKRICEYADEGNKKEILAAIRDMEGD